MQPRRRRRDRLSPPTPPLRLLPLLLLLHVTRAFTPRISAVVTGGNRGLGLATAELLAEVGYRVILTARNEKEGRARAIDIQRRHGQDRCEFVPLDVSKPESIQTLMAHLKQDKELREGMPHLWINNAGMCARNEDEAAAVEGSGGREGVYKRTLDINAWGPVALMDACLPCMQKRGFGCVINISSGDGELAYLHSLVAKRLRQMKSMGTLRQYANRVASKQEQGPWPKGGGLAPVAWPAYCFSKSVLNTATRLMHARTQEAAAEAGRSGRRLRVLALCPGDVATSMCDDDAVDEAVSPREAALDVVWAALHPTECPGGFFYRHRRVIPW